MLIIPCGGKASELNLGESLANDSSKVEVQGSVHAGVGLLSGGRLGIGLRIHTFSVEAALGYVLQNFIGATDVDRRLTLGVSWKPNEQDNLAFGFLLVTRARPALPRYFEDLYFSLNVGSLPSVKKGFGVFIRGGLTFRYAREQVSSSREFSFRGPNLDAGVFLVLF